MAAPSIDEMEAFRATVENAIEHGHNTMGKAVLQQLVVDVRDDLAEPQLDAALALPDEAHTAGYRRPTPTRLAGATR